MPFFYAYFSRVLGPKMMENRKPFNLRNVLIYLMSGWWGSYSFRCQPVDYSNDPMALRMANTCWWYYFSKFTEFFDTLFFILRKKNSHVSTLHVIHHGCMPFSVWMGMKFAPGGHSTFFALLNTFVHIFQLLFTECNYPKGFMVWIALHGIMFFFLFSDFYKVKYTNDKKPARKSENNGACMPVLDDAPNGLKKSSSNGTLNNTYIKSEYSDSYEAYYSNGSTKGFVAQTITKQPNNKKIE
nr:unnamed protein product [Callosobruchus analis]